MVAYSDAQTSRSVKNLQSKTREYVEGHRRNLEAKIDQNHAETRRAANETQAAVDKLSAQLAQLSTQLTEFQPAHSTDVAIGQNQLSQDVNVRLQAHAQRIDTVTDSVQKIERDSADNTKLLHDLVISMENLGESLKQIKSEVKVWEEDEIPMETDEDKLHHDMQKSLLEEVSLCFPHVGTAGNTSANTPISIPIFVSVPIQTQILSEPSTSDLTESADQRMKNQLDNLRAPVSKSKATSEGFNSSFSFSTPASVTLPYPRRDGHPRRITPILVTLPILPTTSLRPILNR